MFIHSFVLGFFIHFQARAAWKQRAAEREKEREQTGAGTQLVGSLAGSRRRTTAHGTLASVTRSSSTAHSNRRTTSLRAPATGRTAAQVGEAPAGAPGSSRGALSKGGGACWCSFVSHHISAIL